MADPPLVTITTGAPGGVVALRLEINEFVNHHMFFSLYIQALTLMQADDQGNTTSHFQVAGIHGLPHVQWNGAGGEAAAVNGPDGYCVHGSVLFPTWHRPYLALYEQIIQGHASQISEGYQDLPNSAEWQEAAKNLRLPFWNWALRTTQGVPADEVLIRTEVQITNSNGDLESVPNPLYQYLFHPIEPTFESPFQAWPQTLRHPSSLAPNALSTPQSVVTEVSSTWEQRNSAIIGLLQDVHNWNEMSTHAVDGVDSSLEAIHNEMHVNIGGHATNGNRAVGHMSRVDYAAHDPIFWLHHANIDRLLWMWQVLNPDVWVNESIQADGTWSIPNNGPIDSTTPLTPFRNSPASFWTSDQVRNTHSLNYTYHLEHGVGGNLPHDPDPEQAGEAVRAIMAQELDLGAAYPGTHYSKGPGPSPSLVSVSSGTDYRDWRVSVASGQFALGGSYSIFVFLGELPSKTQDWSTSKSLVGIHDIFGRSNPEKCANCNLNPDLINHGIVYLGPALHRAGLASREPDVVVPYLTKNLHWRVFQPEKGEVNCSDLESLKVSVFSIPVHLGKFPRQSGKATYHPDVTRGRQGGANDEF